MDLVLLFFFFTSIYDIMTTTDVLYFYLKIATLLISSLGIIRDLYYFIVDRNYLISFIQGSIDKVLPNYLNDLYFEIKSRSQNIWEINLYESILLCCGDKGKTTYFNKNKHVIYSYSIRDNDIELSNNLFNKYKENINEFPEMTYMLLDKLYDNIDKINWKIYNQNEVYEKFINFEHKITDWDEYPDVEETIYRWNSILRESTTNYTKRIFENIENINILKFQRIFRKLKILGVKEIDTRLFLIFYIMDYEDELLDLEFDKNINFQIYDNKIDIFTDKKLSRTAILSCTNFNSSNICYVFDYEKFEYNHIQLYWKNFSLEFENLNHSNIIKLINKGVFRKNVCRFMSPLDLLKQISSDRYKLIKIDKFDHLDDNIIILGADEFYKGKLVNLEKVNERIIKKIDIKGSSVIF